MGIYEFTRFFTILVEENARFAHSLCLKNPKKKTQLSNFCHWILQFFLKHRSFLASRFTIQCLKLSKVFFSWGDLNLESRGRLQRVYMFFLKFWKRVSTLTLPGAILLTPSLRWLERQPWGERKVTIWRQNGKPGRMCWSEGKRCSLFTLRIPAVN